MISKINEDENCDDQIFICFKLPANSDTSERGQITLLVYMFSRE